MICSNCGVSFNGNFCPNCGMPASGPTGFRQSPPAQGQNPQPASFQQFDAPPDSFDTRDTGPSSFKQFHVPPSQRDNDHNVFLGICLLWLILSIPVGILYVVYVIFSILRPFIWSF